MGACTRCRSYLPVTLARHLFWAPGPPWPAAGSQQCQLFYVAISVFLVVFFVCLFLQRLTVCFAIGRCVHLEKVAIALVCSPFAFALVLLLRRSSRSNGHAHTWSFAFHGPLRVKSFRLQDRCRFIAGFVLPGSSFVSSFPRFPFRTASAVSPCVLHHRRVFMFEVLRTA